MTAASDAGFVFTGVLDGEGGARLLEVDQLAVQKEQGRVEWVHLDITKEPARQWLHDQPDLPELAVEGLLAPDTEPRYAELDDGILLILREVNTHENADPHDMISLRLWIGPAPACVTLPRSRTSRSPWRRNRGRAPFLNFFVPSAATWPRRRPRFSPA